MPGARASLLPRPRVAAALAEAARTHALTVVSAPMGYGKTTAAREAAARLALPAFFADVPPGPHNAPYLWDVVFGQLAKQGMKIAGILQRQGFPTDAARRRRLFDQCRADTQPAALVIDDYHNVADPEMDAILAALARENLPDFRMIIFSRTRPGLPLEEMRLKGQAALFEQEFLAFTREETEELFRLHGEDSGDSGVSGDSGDTKFKYPNRRILEHHVPGIPGISGIADAARAAWEFSSGWAAVLWLCLQSWRRHGVVAPARDVEALLGESLFSTYDAAEQELLVRLSLLDGFTAEEASLLDGGSVAVKRLRGLYAKDTLLRHDPVTGRYHIHDIFRSFLLKRLDADFPDRPALYRRSGECCILRGDMIQAFRFLARAGRDEDLLRLLEAFLLPGGNLTVFFFPEEVAAMVAAIPWRLREERPLAYLAYLYYCLAEAGDLRAAALLEEAEERFAKTKRIAAALKKRIAGEALLIKSLLAFNDLWAMRDIHEAAHRLLGGRSSIQNRHMVWTFGCPHTAYLYLREAGTYQATIELVEGNLHYFHELTDGCSKGAEPLFRAEWLLERGEFAEVEAILAAAGRQAEAKEQTATLLNIAFTLARLRMAEGKPDQAADLLAAWRPKVEALGHIDFANCLDLAIGYVAGVLGIWGHDVELFGGSNNSISCPHIPRTPASNAGGDIDSGDTVSGDTKFNYPNRRIIEHHVPRNHVPRIPEWLREDAIDPSRHVVQMLGFIHVVQAKAALLACDYKRADAIAKSLPACLGPFNNLFGRIHAKALEAAAAHYQRHPAKACELLAEAVELARPDGIVLGLAEYGGHIRPIVRQLRNKASGDDFLALLAKLTEHYARFAPKPSSKKKAGSPLSSREAEMLGLVAKGMSNAAVGKRLGVTENTVKNTLRSAFAKLKAKNRVEAVRKFADGRQREG